MSRAVRRVRFIQVGGLVLVIVLSLGAIASALVAYEVRALSGDVSRANSRLPASVQSRLASNSGGTLDSNQVTLVSYGSGLARGTSVLFATAPGAHFSSILSISPAVRIGSETQSTPGRPGHTEVGTPLGQMTTNQAILALRSAGIPVTRVALINAGNVEPLVQAVGGITVANRAAFTVTENGRSVTFKQGRLRLDGAQAATYVHTATTRESLGTAENAALVGIIQAVIAQSGVEHLRSVGSALAGATATDLTPADVIGLVDMRIRGLQLVDCRLSGPGNLADPGLSSVVNQALGRTSVSSPVCQARYLAAAPIVPPTAVVNAVQHYGWPLFAGLAIILGTVAVLLAGALRTWWPSARARR